MKRFCNLLMVYNEDPAHRPAVKHVIDLVVMVTLSKTGLAGLIAGNAAEKVFHTANCSVMAVKPPDFVSPVLLP